MEGLAKVRFQTCDFGPPSTRCGSSNICDYAEELGFAVGAEAKTCSGPRVFTKLKSVIRNQVALAAILVGAAGTSGCAPPGIPDGATGHWSLLGGSYWTWTRNSEQGCAAWMAKESWADVQLIVGSRCKGARENGYLAGQGLGYFSSTDELVFRGYWPWSIEYYSGLIVYDDEGMTKEIRPCPYSLSAEQVARMQRVAQEALAGAQTDGERRVLARVARRLSVLEHRAFNVTYIRRP